MEAEYPETFGGWGMSAKLFDSDDVTTRLWLYINEVYGGSQRALARECNIDHSHLSRVLSGEKKPGHKILDLVGMQAVIYYENKP
jgi:hypothetical protein